MTIYYSMITIHLHSYQQQIYAKKGKEKTLNCEYLQMIFCCLSLKNIGATCYMNSILQCLLNIDPFRYDLMVTNAELITSPLLEENTIYL